MSAARAELAPDQLFGSTSDTLPTSPRSSPIPSSRGWLTDASVGWAERITAVRDATRSGHKTSPETFELARRWGGAGSTVPSTTGRPVTADGNPIRMSRTKPTHTAERARLPAH